MRPNTSKGRITKNPYQNSASIAINWQIVTCVLPWVLSSQSGLNIFKHACPPPILLISNVLLLIPEA